MHSIQSTGKHFYTISESYVYLVPNLFEIVTLTSQLFIIGVGEIEYTEGTTQGDPTAMIIYVIAIIPLILMIIDITHQDDSYTKTAADDGKIIQLKKWWDALCQLSPKFGYYPEGVKS